ncbi:MAG TPA: hypothetical protein VFC18_09705 [Burkholderiales bacterium]|nr:hypothetical protein [Burkholderiales bacterium]
MKQHIHFCPARDGVQLAYARMGAGAPLVKAANWLTSRTGCRALRCWGWQFLVELVPIAVIPHRRFRRPDDA